VYIRHSTCFFFHFQFGHLSGSGCDKLVGVTMALSKVRGSVVVLQKLQYLRELSFLRSRKILKVILFRYCFNTWKEGATSGNYNCNPMFYISIYVTTGRTLKSGRVSNNIKVKVKLPS
jgi:hypothetical protein